jgi:hypothetical protein
VGYLRGKRDGFVFGKELLKITMELDPEDGGNMFLRKVGSLSTDCTALYPEDNTLHNDRCNSNPTNSKLALPNSYKF